jgi:ABC-type phosphate transport system substrate-binding protein
VTAGLLERGNLGPLRPAFSLEGRQEGVLQLLRMPTVIGFLAAAASASAIAADVSGAGATFAYPIYAKWADA